MKNTNPFSPVRRWNAAFCLTLAAVLSACGGGGNSDGSGNPVVAQTATDQGGETPQNLAAAKTADVTSQAAATDAGAKALAASSLRNLTIASFDPASPQWLVRAVIDERFFDNQNGKGVALNSVARFAGICAAGPAPCRFDTYAVEQLADGTIFESVTAYGRYWLFDVAGNLLAGSGSDLKTVARYASGPCLQAVQTNVPCKFESRSIGRLGKDSPIWVESITAYGRGYNFDENGTPFGGNGFDLKSIGRFAQGPCASVPGGTPCQFTARTFHPILTGAVDGASWLEWIVRDGLVWVFDLNGAPRDPNTYQRTASTSGTPADQVNILKNIFANSGYTLILPGQSQASFSCNLKYESFFQIPISSPAPVMTFKSNGEYVSNSENENRTGNFQFDAMKGQIVFSGGAWKSPPPATGRFTQLDFNDNNKLLINAFYPGNDYLGRDDIVITGTCNRVATGTPPPVVNGGNPLIPAGSSIASFKCVLPATALSPEVPVGFSDLRSNGSYNFTGTQGGTTEGQYLIIAPGKMQFFSGYFWITNIQETFGSFLSNGNAFFASVPVRRNGSLEPQTATCERYSSGKGGVDAGTPKTTIALPDEATACLNYPDANQCEASKLFVSILGIKPDPSAVAYWADVPMATAEKRKQFIETYKGTTTALITRFYKACLLREPDPEGLTNWRYYLEGNGAVATARIFAGSDEAVAKGSPCTVTVN